MPSPSYATASLAIGCTLAVSVGLAQGLRINEVVSANEATVADERGIYADWVEVVNYADGPVELAGYRLDDGDDFAAAWAMPDTTLAPGALLLIWCDGAAGDTVSDLHADFGIAARGEALVLFAPDGRVVDRAPAEAIPADHSLGRPVDDRESWSFFTEPTPLAPNDGPPLGPRRSPPLLSRTPQAAISAPFELQLLSESPGDTVRYTLDGSPVTGASPAYEGPLALVTNTVVRARSFRGGALPSVPVVASYLFERSPTLPTLSLAVAPDDFYGPDGLYTRPSAGNERALHVEYFDTTGRLGFGQGMGVKMHAPDRFQQKSMRLYARGRYGSSTVEYPLFETLPVERFRRLILRNGGNDGTEKKRLHVKDGFAHALYAEIRPHYATAAYEPVSVFLNGDYFGIYNLRERQDEHYLRTHYDVGCEEVDFLEYDYAERDHKKIICGDWTAWESLKTYILDHDLSEPAAYAHVAEQIDVDDFIDYQAFEIFIGNVDWLNNNIKFWRERKPGGKWRWLLWDAEYGMGTLENDAGEPDFDFMTMAKDWGGWGNEDWTWMLRGLVANEGFRRRFLTRYGDLLNTTLRPGHVGPTLDEAVGRIRAELPRQLDHWGGTEHKYDAHLEKTHDFLARRADLARRNAAVALGLDTVTRTIDVDVSERGAGRVRVNSISLSDGLPWLRGAPAYPWRGSYLRELPTTITAIPAPGYRFSHWRGVEPDVEDSTAATLVLDLGIDRDLLAVFEAAAPAPMPRLLINEIVADNLASHTDTAGRAADWIEVYNAGTNTVDIGGLYLSDDSTVLGKWQIPVDDPAATTIAPGGYLTLFADGKPQRGARHLDFKLSKAGEYVGLARWGEAEAPELIDAVAFPALSTDEAYARLPDGGATWGQTTTATPGTRNEATSSVSNQDTALGGFELSPNPADAFVRVGGDSPPGSRLTLEFRDLLGRRVMRTRLPPDEVVDVSVLPKGAYYATLSSPGHVSVVRLFVKR